MENGYWWCRRKKQRSGVLLTVGTRPDGRPDERWCFRVEEVNWAAWEQMLPTVCEDPTGEGIPGTMKNPGLTTQPEEEPFSQEAHLPLQVLQSH
ncbi:transient receptor potential cation channel subfamily V member 2-like isoform X2 [Heterocephalus glaber]|uniref:Transient receptor potential cation channel subfamily V member 2-like isoform X2 n=1 Tax=Heterocephalus glaber TaxID=10181 RepID=A0AAX6QH27_HETGA|nr:transient receptor potential cation channel subfamily V member 2-like isoform X2 [Heterocephalus glaber]